MRADRPPARQPAPVHEDARQQRRRAAGPGRHPDARHAAGRRGAPHARGHRVLARRRRRPPRPPSAPATRRSATTGSGPVPSPTRWRDVHPVAPRRLGPAAGAAARLHRHVAVVGAGAARARAPARRARADAGRPRRRAADRRRGRPTTCSPTRSRRRWTRRASRPRTSPATRSAATSRCSSPRAGGRGPSWRSRPPAAGREATSPTGRARACSRELHRAGATPRRRTPRRSLATPEGRRRATRLHHVELRAHPGRAARPPAARRRRLRGGRAR